MRGTGTGFAGHREPAVADDMAAILAGLKPFGAEGEPFVGRTTNVRTILERRGSMRSGARSRIAAMLLVGAVGVALGVAIRDGFAERGSVPLAQAPARTAAPTGLAVPPPRLAAVSTAPSAPRAATRVEERPLIVQRATPAVKDEQPPLQGRSALPAPDPDAPLFRPSIAALARGTPIFRANPAAPPQQFPPVPPAPVANASAPATTVPPSPEPAAGEPPKSPPT